jgi:hypothetical protein
VTVERVVHAVYRNGTNGRPLVGEGVA